MKTRKPARRKTAKKPRSTRATVSADKSIGKVFWTGRSQAVRIPKEYRVSAKELRFRRQGEAIVMEPIEEECDELGWPIGWVEKMMAGPKVDFEIPPSGPSDVREPFW